MLALIDGDICAYRVGWTTENDPVGIAFARLDEMLDGILLDTSASEYKIYLSDGRLNNFRYQIYPEYKANRDTLPRPKHLEAIKEYLLLGWKAYIAHGMEADDALGIEQCFHNENGSYEDYDYGKSVICSIDKDLQQIPGAHYNFVKKEHTLVTPDEGLRHFYSQILTGDNADNIGGCPGIGPVKATRILDKAGTTDKEFARAIFETYLKKLNIKEEKAAKEILAYIEKIGQVLKIRQEEDEPLWHFPLENPMEVLTSLSTQPKQEAVTQSTEHITTEKNGSRSVGSLMEQSSPSRVT